MEIQRPPSVRPSGESQTLSPLWSPLSFLPITKETKIHQHLSRECEVSNALNCSMVSLKHLSLRLYSLISKLKFYGHWSKYSTEIRRHCGPKLLRFDYTFNFELLATEAKRKALSYRVSGHLHGTGGSQGTTMHLTLLSVFEAKLKLKP